MSRSPKTLLTSEEQGLAYVMAIEHNTIREIFTELGFSDAYDFHKYRKANPIFDSEFIAARAGGCDELEDRMLQVADTFEDPKRGRVMLESIRAVLAYRNPQKYGQRVDLNVNQHLDLSTVLAAAQSRIVDVTPQNHIPIQIPSRIEDIL